MIGIRSTGARGLILVAALFFVGCGSEKTTSTGETKPVAAEAEAQKSPTKAEPAASDKAKAAAPIEPTTVTLWFAYRAEEQKALEETVKAFNEKKGPVQIDAIPVPYDAFVDKLELTIPNGHGPDLFIFAHNMIGHWSKQEMIEPLSGKASSDILGRFLPETVKALVHNKTLYGLPMAFKNLALYYNKDLVPTPPTSFAEVRTIQKVDEKTPILGYESGLLYFHAPFLHGFGGVIFDDSGAPKLDNPEAIQALEFAKSLLDEGVTAKGLTSVTLSALFNEGKLPLVMNGPWFRGEIAKDLNYGVASLPSIGEGKSLKPFLGSEAVFISAKSNAKDAAFVAAEFLTSNEAAQVRATIAGQTVANTVLYEGESKSDRADMAVFRAGAKNAVVMPAIATMQKVWSHYDTAILKVLSGSASASEALKIAQEQVATTSKDDE